MGAGQLTLCFQSWIGIGLKQSESRAKPGDSQTISPVYQRKFVGCLHGIFLILILADKSLYVLVSEALPAVLEAIFWI